MVLTKSRSHTDLTSLKIVSIIKTTENTSFQINMVNLNFDILSLIFIEAIHTGSSSVLTLRLVNRAWYEITGRTPQLWTKLVLERKSHFTDLEYVQLYLQKSGTLPIDVHITLPDDVDFGEIEGVAGLLHGHTAKFRSFDLHVPMRDALENFMFFIAEGMPAPLLESLRLRVQRCTPCDTCFLFVSLFTGFTPAPRLAHIEIPGWPLPDSLPQLPQITSITIDSMSLDYISIHKMISFLSCTPSLQHFVYKGYGESRHTGVDLDDPLIVHLPDLITIDVTAPGSGGDILCFINAPALTDARLDGFRPYDVEGLQQGYLTASLTDTVLLLSTYSRNLQRLTLEYTEFLETPGDFKTIFNDISFPHLEEVLLIATDVSDETLMNCSRSSSLKKLELRDCERVTGTGLLEFVRCQGSDFFLSMKGCRNLNMTQEDMDAISEMIKVEGLH